jgi:hypothetical protein
MSKSTKYNLCTFFDRNYLYKGLVLYKSLKRTTKNFVLWILCTDEESYLILKKLRLKHAHLTKLEEVENKELLQVKKDRSKAEYSLTLKPAYVDYILRNNKSIKDIYYVDSDIAFFQNAKYVFELAEKASIAISPHDFPISLRGREKRAGKYNAGAIYFKNDKESLTCLNRWRKQCIKWCYWKVENGKMGDQMYLDEWPKLYKKIKIFNHKGINLAPWNIKKYKLSKKRGDIYVDGDKLIFYHFHQFKILSNQRFLPSHLHKIPKKALFYIYKPYEKLINSSIQEVKKEFSNFSYGINTQTKTDIVKRWIIHETSYIYWMLLSLT